MKHSIRWSIVAACTVLLCNTVLVRPAFADLILTGTYLLPSAGDSKVIPFLEGQFDPNSITMGLCFPEDLLVDVTPYIPPNPFLNIGLHVWMLIPEFRVNCPNVGEAIFLFVTPPPNGTANVAFNNFPGDPSGEFTAGLSLISDLTGLFGAFQTATLIIDFSGLDLDPNGDGRATWPIPPGRTVNVRFQLVSTVPEPTSLALAVCGLIGLTAMRGLRRRQCQSLKTCR